MEYDTEDLVQALFDEKGLQDILLGVEEYFDNQDLYAFEGWIDGEVVEGPIVTKYWVEVTLKYRMDKLPDPRGTYMFHNQGTKIQVRRDIEEKPLDYARGPEDMMTTSGAMPSMKVQIEEIPVLLVKFTIPRRLVDPGTVKEYELMDKDLEEEEVPAPEQMEAPAEEEQETEELSQAEGGDPDEEEMM